MEEGDRLHMGQLANQQLHQEGQPSVGAREVRDKQNEPGGGGGLESEAPV